MTESSTDTTKAFYDRISRAYDLIAAASEHESRERGLELLVVAPGSTVLEIGYGTGHNLVALAAAVGEGGTVYGIDLSEGMRAVASERLAAAGVTVAQLDLGDARALPYPAATFDAVAMSFTLELFELDEIPGVLAGVRRVLKAGGRLGVVALESDESSGLVDFYRWFHRHFPHIVDCQPIPLSKLLEDAGFCVEAYEKMSIWGLPVAAVVARLKSA